MVKNDGDTRLYVLTAVHKKVLFWTHLIIRFFAHSRAGFRDIVAFDLITAAASRGYHSGDLASVAFFVRLTCCARLETS